MRKLKKFFKQTSRRWSWLLYRKRHILKRQISDFLKGDVKLHIGCGDKRLQGYINIDIVPTESTDAVMDVTKELHLIPPNIASEIRLENVFEHFYRYEQKEILQQSQRILKKGGNLVIRGLPDFDAIIDAYLKKKPGIVSEQFDLYNVYRYTHGDPTPQNSPHQLHKDIFTKDSVKALLESNGFYIKELASGPCQRENLAISIYVIATKK